MTLTFHHYRQLCEFARRFAPRHSRLLGLTAVLAGLVMLAVHFAAAKHVRAKVLGLNKVIFFAEAQIHSDPKQLHSVTFVGPTASDDWKYWQSRGVVVGISHTWFDLLRSPIDQAVENLTSLNYGGNPHPVLIIDEFGFDYGGHMDEKSAEILRRTKLKKPDLALAVWQMRGPIPQVLADAYRDAADLVMMESYLHDKRQYWWMAAQVWSARRYGLLSKTIIGLGVGKGGNPGEDWAETGEELEQQIRFIRLIAPESPGVGFFTGTPDLLARADMISARFEHLPTNGSGLPEDVRALAQTFSAPHARPTLVVSPSLVEPNYNEDGKTVAEPKTFRVYIINLGDNDARNVTLRLRNPPGAGGNVFAQGVVPLIPARREVIGVLDVSAIWRVWVGRWILEVDAPGCEVLSYSLHP